MSGHDVVEIARLVAVIALVCVAAAFATPKGRLPLALRGLAKLLRQDAVPAASTPQGADQSVSLVKRLLAFALVLLAILLAIA